MSISDIAGNIESVRARIEKACSRVGRDPGEVILMAVTKTKTREEAEAAYDAGIRVFGENRVFEAEEKYAGFHSEAELHLVGHLQSNKAKQAADLFSWVQSIDKFKTVGALEKRLAESGRKMNILFEVNTSGESSKFGYPSVNELLKDMDKILRLNHIRPRGLMTIAPFTEDETEIRKSFRSLAKIFLACKERFPLEDFDVLSMGMSQDFEIAIEEGATMVRLGSVIFGARPA
jgi:hypothetical protein